MGHRRFHSPPRLWFAWYPVRGTDGGVHWLCLLWRVRVEIVDGDRRTVAWEYTPTREPDDEG